MKEAKGLSKRSSRFHQSSSSSLSFKCALRESGYRIGYEPTKINRDHFKRSTSMDTNVEVSALSTFVLSSPKSTK